MSFSQFVWKMAKVDYKKYIFYYACNSFAVMFFFLFSTIYFNDEIVKIKITESIQAVLTIPSVALIIFTVFFISYAHDVFMKQRKSEFGLFMAIGMSSKEIGKLLLLENIVISFLSLVSGLLAGGVFSKLFFLIFVNYLDVENIDFHLNRDMFIYPIGIFLTVFYLAVGKSLFSVFTQNITLHLKSDLVKESLKMRSPAMGFIGLLFIIGSVLGLYFTYAEMDAESYYLFLWIILTLSGLYIAMGQYTSLYIDLTKKNRPYYYRRMLFLTNMDYKFKQLTAVLMLVTVMVFVTLLYSTINVASYMLVEKETIEINPYDLGFIQTEDKNNITEDELTMIFKDNPIKEHIVIPIYSYYKQWEDIEWMDVYNFMSIDTFNELTSRKIQLEEEEMIFYINENLEDEEIESYYLDNGYPFMNEELKRIIAERKINLFGGTGEFVVLTEQRLARLKEELAGFESNIHLINVKNWKSSLEPIEELNERLKAYNKTTKPLSDIRMDFQSEESLFYVESRVESYENIQMPNRISLFILTISSIIFFLGSYLLLYLSLFAEIDKEKEKIHKLHLLGMTSKEIKKLISSEIWTLFFIPTILGSVLALLYWIAMATDVGGVMANPELLIYFSVIVGIYYMIQTGVYMYAKKKMFKLIFD